MASHSHRGVATLPTKKHLALVFGLLMLCAAVMGAKDVAFTDENITNNNWLADNRLSICTHWNSTEPSFDVAAVDLEPCETAAGSGWVNVTITGRTGPGGCQPNATVYYYETHFVNLNYTCAVDDNAPWHSYSLTQSPLGEELKTGTVYAINVWFINHTAGNMYLSANIGMAANRTGKSVGNTNYTNRPMSAKLWNATAGGPAGSSNSVSFTGSIPANGSDTLIATRNYTYTPQWNNTVNISSCSLSSNCSNCSSPVATHYPSSNATEDGFLITLPSEQTHEYTVVCTNNDTSLTDTGNYTYKYHDYDTKSESHDSEETELTNSNYTYAIDLGELVDGVVDTDTSVVYYDEDGSVISSVSAFNMDEAYSGKNLTMYRYNLHPAYLVATNNSSMQIAYRFNLNYSNSTTGPFIQTANYTQGLQWGYYENLSVNPTAYLEGETVTASTTVTNTTSLATITVYHYWNSTQNTATLSGSTYNSTFTTPTLGAQYFWDYLNSTLNLAYGGDSLNRTSPDSVNVSVWKASITDCSGAGAVAINFTFADAGNLSTGNSSMSATFWGYPEGFKDLNQTLSNNWTNLQYIEICVLPAWASFRVDSWQTYELEGAYEQRAYFLDNASISNTTNNITLYGGTDADTKLITFSIDDTDGQGLEDAFISFTRYYVGEDVYRTVAMILTDDYGEGSTYLVPNDIYYRVVVNKDGDTLQIFDPATIPCAPSADSCTLALSLEPDEYLEYTQYYDQFAYACAFNATGLNYITCSYSDSSGLMRYARLVVNEAGLFSPVGICDTQVTTSSGSVSCNISGYLDTTVTYSFSAHFFEETLLEADVIGYEAGALFGAEGLLIALVLFLVVAAVGAHNPAISVFMGFVGLLFASAMGLFGMEISAVVAIGVVAGVIMFKMRGG